MYFLLVNKIKELQLYFIQIMKLNRKSSLPLCCGPSLRRFFCSKVTKSKKTILTTCALTLKNSYDHYKKMKSETFSSYSQLFLELSDKLEVG